MTNKQLVEYVDQNIGSISHLLTTPPMWITLPHGMARATLATPMGIGDRYLADILWGFQVGPICVMADTLKDCDPDHSFTTMYDPDFEVAQPHYYSLEFVESEILAECTASRLNVVLRFTFPKHSKPSLRFTANSACALIANSDGSAQGHAIVGKSDDLDGIPQYFYAAFSQKPEQTYLQKAEGSKEWMQFDFVPSPEKQVIEVKIALSYIDTEQAKENSLEIAGLKFESVCMHAKEQWNHALSKIEIQGASEEKKTIFYTALHRSLLRMVNITEQGGRYYSVYDNRVHQTGEQDFYTTDNIWDSYRCMHPLQLLLEPSRQNDMVQSYVRMYEQSGWLTQFPAPEGDQPVMLGNHTAAMIWDTYLKGNRRFNVEKAYEAMRKNAMEQTMLPWVNGSLTELDRFYLENGFFPALAKGEAESVEVVHDREKRQAVAVTLEHAYNDWCIAQMAKALGKEDDYKYFSRRALNYQNVYCKETGFMSPRSADGNWVEGFDPKFGGGQGGRDYFAECNSWIYSFHVQHDVFGLMQLMGGSLAFEKRLDRLFTELYDGPKFEYLAQFPDSTGLIGMYCHGNEPAFHIPYLYNYTHSPWKTQRRVRQIMDVWYGANPLGICGDEDNGAMSSWFVFSSMGFYPVCPGNNRYDLGSPLFETVVVHLENGKDFVIKAENVSKQNKYIQSAQLNGLPLNRPYFQYEEIAQGGTLTLTMGNRPNRNWGME